MEKEQSDRIILNDELIKRIILNPTFTTGLADCWNRYHRLKRNKMMYEICTPTLTKWWQKLRGIKPYMNRNYEPKF